MGTRRGSVWVKALSSMAGVCATVAAGGSLLAWLPGCQNQAEIQRLEQENLELRKQLVDCEFAKTKSKMEALDCELRNTAVKYGGPPALPAGSAPPAGSVKPCDCEPGDPLCPCL